MEEPILQFFGYTHLPTALQDVSKPFHDLAHKMCGTPAWSPLHASTPPLLPRNPERTVALRKLLEAKDAAVRAAIFVSNAPPPPGA